MTTSGEERRKRAAAAQARYAARMRAEHPEEWSARQVKATRKWRAKDPRRQKAHRAVQSALKRGILTRPDRCERCGKACKPEASHDDYDRPLDVEWLCRPCHVAKDRPPKAS